MLDEKTLFKEAENAIKWIKEYVQKTGAKGVVVGNSGGKDSATVIAMSVKALGKENVLTVSMPCNSIKEDLEDAKLVSKTFEVQFLEADLTKTYNELELKLNTSLDELGKKLVNESKVNIKPRLRMTTLYGIAQSLGYLVIGTGNLCETIVGYTTKWGDSGYDFNPIANFTVEEVLKIGEYLKVPEKVIKKAPNDGLGGKTDEEKMGVTYSQIAEYIETGKTDETAMKIIDRLNKVSSHKRNKIPIYEFNRTKFLK